MKIEISFRKTRSPYFKEALLVAGQIMDMDFKDFSKISVIGTEKDYLKFYELLTLINGWKGTTSTIDDVLISTLTIRQLITCYSQNLPVCRLDYDRYYCRYCPIQTKKVFKEIVERKDG